MHSEKSSDLKKYSITIRGHRTSYSLEKQFHDELEILAKKNNEPLARLITRVDEERDANNSLGESVNLSSALRLLVLSSLKNTNKLS